VEQPGIVQRRIFSVTSVLLQQDPSNRLGREMNGVDSAAYGKHKSRALPGFSSIDCLEESTFTIAGKSNLRAEKLYKVKRPSVSTFVNVNPNSRARWTLSSVASRKLAFCRKRRRSRTPTVRHAKIKQRIKLRAPRKGINLSDIIL
jgi:hypothetical protein